MSVLKRTIHILFFLLAFVFVRAHAQEDSIHTVTFAGDVFGRSSLNFRNKKNISGVVPQGSEGQVLEVRRLKSGSYGVRVRITKVNGDRGKTTAKVNDEAWVYYSQKLPWLNFPDKNGVEIQDPEEALLSRVNLENGILPPKEGLVEDPALPDKKEVLENSKPDVDPNLAKQPDTTKTEADFCATCNAPAAAPPTERNLIDLSAVVRAYHKAPAQTDTPIDPHSKWANDPMVAKYSTSRQTQKMIDYALRNKRSHSTKYCYRYVKRALVASDMVKQYPPGGYARQAVRDLKAQGMINMLDNPKYRALIKNPSDAPKGAVIVYWNSTTEAGDVQIKTGEGDKGGYVSDFYSKSSFLSSPKARYYAKIHKPYKIIGVMIKP